MIVFAEEAAEAVVAADAQTRECRGIGDRFGQRLQGSGILDAPVRPVGGRIGPTFPRSSSSGASGRR